jgi:hypothetical protein
MRHEFFDKVLTNKETVDYVIDHLAAANFDWVLRLTKKEIQKQFINQFVGTKQYEQINWQYPSHENIEMDGIQKLGITLGLLGLFIMTLALFNVSFLTKDFG